MAFIHNVMAPAFKKAADRFIAVLFWMAIPTAIWNFTSVYYVFQSNAGDFLLISFFIFLTLGLPGFYIYETRFGGPKLESKSLIAFRFLPHFFKRIILKVKNPSEFFFINEKTRVAFLAVFIKIFFFPLMLEGVLGNGYIILNFIYHPFLPLVDISLAWRIYYLIFAGLIFLDASIFALAYIAESKSLNNEIKSVDPTLSGWIVALLCYQPFNRWFYQFRETIIPSFHFELPKTNELLLIIFLALSLLSFALYLWASFALGYKAGNLVNRGIVKTGPYAFIRHPSYMGKNIGWLFILIPVLSDISQILLFISLAFIYFLRAVTEERHLHRDPEYLSYCKKVPYRFIPGIY